jgi:hypothetical protein
MIKFFDFQGKQIPYKLSLLALQKWEASQKNKEGDDYLTLFKYALEAGHKISGEKFDLTPEQVEILFENYSLEFLDEILDFFSTVQEKMNKVGAVMQGKNPK